MIVPARKQYRVTTEENVPMKTRDGITLYADIVRPDSDERFPALLSRTPYGKTGATDPNGPNSLYAQYGYVSITQDCRGRFASEGEYDTIFQEAADGYDAVEWAARLPCSNGRVGRPANPILDSPSISLLATIPCRPLSSAWPQSQPRRIITPAGSIRPVGYPSGAGWCRTPSSRVSTP